jgi:hypothetical protein
MAFRLYYEYRTSITRLDSYVLVVYICTHRTHYIHTGGGFTVLVTSLNTKMPKYFNVCIMQQIQHVALICVCFRIKNCITPTFRADLNVGWYCAYF